MTVAIPLVKITVEGMRHEIVQAISMHMQGIQEAVEHQVKVAVENFDFEREVRAVAYRALQNEFEAAVKRAVHEAVWTDDVRKALAEKAAELLAAGIRGE